MHETEEGWKAKEVHSAPGKSLLWLGWQHRIHAHH